MYIKILDVRDIVSYLAIEIEKHYPYGFDVDPDKMWEVLDNCFFEPQLQSERDNDLYEAYSNNICTCILDEIFNKLFLGINSILDSCIDRQFRFTIPDSVYYLGSCEFKILWRSEQ